MSDFSVGKLQFSNRWKPFEHLFDAMAIVTSNKRVVYANERFRKLAQLSEATDNGFDDITNVLNLPDNCWEPLLSPSQNTGKLAAPTLPPSIQSVPFSFRGGSKGFAQVFVEALQEPGESVFLCVLHDITFEIQSRTQIDESERIIAELRRRHSEAHFLWRLSTETPIYLDPPALLTTVAKKLKEDLGFADAAFMTLPATADEVPNPIGTEYRVGSRLREVAVTLVPTLLRKTNRTDVFSVENETFGTFWVTSFRPKLEKPFFLLARSEQSAKDSNRRSLLDPLAAQMTGWLDNRAVYLSSITDSLTGLFNRRHFDSRFAVECILARERQMLVSLMVLDIDYFKKVNDTYGHQVGDVVLKSAAQTLKNALRTTDITARVGGEEFAAIMFDTSTEDAIKVAEKVRKKIEETPIAIPGSNLVLNITVSIGISGFDGEGTPDSVYALADSALYRAKAEGRNTVRIAENTSHLA
jgi:diguanylate cyclase (GGDEF)-like protein